MSRGRHRKPAPVTRALVPALLVPGVLSLSATGADATTVAPVADSAAAPAPQADSAAAPAPQADSAAAPAAQPAAEPTSGPAAEPTAAEPTPEAQQQAAPAQRPVRTRTWLGRSQAVAPGRPAVLTAAVSDAAGTPVAGRKVVVYKLTPQGWRGNAAGWTGEDGTARITVSTAGTARFGAGYAGDGTHGGSSTPQPVTVTVKVTQDRVQKALRIAAAQQGKPYRYGSDGPSSFDCSGFVRYVMGQVGVSLPHNSRAQYSSARKIPASQLRVGDLVFTKRGSGIGHVGIYAGKGEWWVARRSGTTITKQRIYTSDIRVGRVL